MIKKIFKKVFSVCFMVRVFAVSLCFVLAPKMAGVFIPEGAPVWFPTFIEWTEIIFYPALAVSMFTLLYHYIAFWSKKYESEAGH